MKDYDKNKCPNTAIVAVPWAGKIFEYCQMHANRIVVLGNAIGSPVEWRRMITDSQCEGANDLHEYNT